MNPEGLVPSFVEIEVLPRFPRVSCKILNEAERMPALQMTSLEIETTSAELGLQKAVLFKVPWVRSKDLTPGQEILVYRENSRPLKWIRLFKILRINEKKAFSDYSSSEVQHIISQVKPYVRSVLTDVMFVIRKRYTSGHQKPSVLSNAALDLIDTKTNFMIFQKRKREIWKGYWSKTLGKSSKSPVIRRIQKH